MRIERINENSIRCTLTNFDLSVRNVNISELSYGSEKARSLFREMMQKASNEVGFDAEDIPIMVEAIPMPNDSIMLIITKVIDPEELDTRFSKFAMTEEEEVGSFNTFAAETLEGADELLNLLGDPAFLESLVEVGSKPEEPHSALPFETTPKTSSPQSSESATDAPQHMRIYQFDTLDLVCAAAKEAGSVFSGESILYKNPDNEKFYLVLKKESCDELSFSKTCNKLSEFAVRQKYEPAVEAYFSEHYELFIKKNALQVLKNLYLIVEVK